MDGLGQPVRRPPPLAVRVETVSTYPFPKQVQTISTLEAPEEVNLAAQAGGRIQSLLIRQGDQVRAGQLLVVLDQTQRQEQVRALEGQRQESLLNSSASNSWRVREPPAPSSATPSATGAGPELEGRVVSIDPRVNSATQTFLVKAALANADGRFRNGERVATRLLLGNRPQLAVPALAVTRVSGQTFVFVAGSLAELRRSPGNVPLAGLGTLPPTSRFALQRPVSLDRLQGRR